MGAILSAREKKIWNKIDEISKGAYVYPKKIDFRMNDMRKYCKSINKK